MEYGLFEEKDLKKLWMPTDEVRKFEGGQVTIVGGSSLFHGAPILALKVASRIVSMVYFASPESDKEVVYKIKADLGSFIWVPREEVGEYIEKSDAALIGPGMMRNGKEKHGFSCDDTGKETRDLTLELLRKYPNKKWVIDGGSLQVIKAQDVPKKAVITPNNKEYKMLFGEEIRENLTERIDQLAKKAKDFGITILNKEVESVVTDGKSAMVIKGGNAGLIRGATGDILAGLTVGFLAKSEPVVAAAGASYLVKKAAEALASRYGLMFNGDDVADKVREVYGEAIK